ncbi:hypothetical protein V7S43_019048 [Phytophthora oleae]|uniref:Uncharacterized protein n=1 Tax=Phytophthora oleae TaxID=2107226 RepID=A0ABD3FTL8_9STRA
MLDVRPVGDCRRPATRPTAPAAGTSRTSDGTSTLFLHRAKHAVQWRSHVSKRFRSPCERHVGHRAKNAVHDKLRARDLKAGRGHDQCTEVPHTGKPQHLPMISNV